jgi:anti-sigma B factor antagonist
MTEEAAPFEISTAEQNGRLHLAPTGELDLSTAPELEPLVFDALRAGRHVVLDLRGLEFMDSSGVRLLIEAHNAAGEGAGRISIVRPALDTPVGQVIDVSGIAPVLEMVADPDELD